MEGTLDIIYRVRPRRVVRQSIMAVGMLVLFIVLIPIMVFASAGPGIVLKLLPFVGSNGFVIWLGGILGGLLVAFVLFEAIYFFVPNQRISWRNSWRGALVSALLLEIFLALFPLYIDNFLKGYAGPIGFAVILLLFFYYFAVILLLGAEINAFFFEGIRPITNDLVTFVSTMAGRLNKDLPGAEAEHHQNTRPTDRADQAHIAEARGQEEKTRKDQG
jgi:uncharacterized BrkB/YihY/UPF0761 family membrane protein